MSKTLYSLLNEVHEQKYHSISDVKKDIRNNKKIYIIMIGSRSIHVNRVILLHT